MKERKVEIPVDYDVKELLKRGKGNMTWDEYMIELKKTYESAKELGLEFGKV